MIQGIWIPENPSRCSQSSEEASQGRQPWLAPVWGPASLGMSEGQPAKACAFSQRLKSGTSGSHTMTLRSLSSSLAQESQLSALGTLSKHLPSTLAIRQEELGEADTWMSSPSQHHKSPPSICIGQTELCQSLVQGLGVLRQPASRQLSRRKRGAATGCVHTLSRPVPSLEQVPLSVVLKPGPAGIRLKEAKGKEAEASAVFPAF